MGSKITLYPFQILELSGRIRCFSPVSAYFLYRGILLYRRETPGEKDDKKAVQEQEGNGSCSNDSVYVAPHMIITHRGTGKWGGIPLILPASGCMQS